MNVNYTVEYKITHRLLIVRIFADLSGSYSHKSNLEYEIPSSAEWLRTTDKCLAKC